MNAPSKEQIERWQADAVTAYHTKAYEGLFDIYWNLTVILRIDYPIPYAGYWDDAKKIKQAAWDAEAANNGEGK